MSFTAAWLLLAAAPAAPAVPVPDPAPDASMVGHYYLSGVREVGSELVLGADGSYAWTMTYGAEDQAQAGRWARVEDSVLLVPVHPAGPLFTLGKVQPWSEAAERQLLEDRRDAAEDKVRAQCPFFTDGWVSPPPPAEDPAAKPSPEALRKAAAATLGQALSARAQVEVLAAQVMAGTAAKDAALPALQAWAGARYAAIYAADAAGLPTPDLADPRLPAACALPPPVEVGVEAGWVGGVGLRLRDGKWDTSLHGVQVIFRFADGKKVWARTGEGGLALVSGPLASPLVEVSVGLDAAPAHSATFKLQPLRRGVVTVKVDNAQPAPAGFDRWELTIKGRDLVWPVFGDAHYSREP